MNYRILFLTSFAVAGCGADPRSGAETQPTVVATAAAKAVQSGGGKAAANDWPRFRGPGGMGVSTDKSVPDDWAAESNHVFKVELPGAGTSQPVTYGDRIYLTGYSGYGVPGQPEGNMNDLQRWVLCLNRADGKQIWKTDIKSVLPEQIATQIREGHGYASNTPVVDGERIYAFFGKSGVVALNHDGKQLWHADVGSKLNGWGTAASPILYKDLVIVNASIESGSLYGLNKKTGEQVWKAGGIVEAWNTPLLVNNGEKTELVVAIIGRILAFDPDAGTPLWNCRTNISWYMVPSLVSHEDVVYCVGGRSGGGLAVRTGGSGDVTESHRLWTAERGSNVPSPILHEGHLYWPHENLGVVYCADLKTGKLAYEQRLDGASGIYSSPVLVGGKIYYLTRTGQVYVVAAEPTFRVINRSDMPRRDGYDSTPAVSRGQILLRTNRYLYCIGN